MRGIRKTYLGSWLALGRVQSVPVSVLAVSFGYLSVEFSIFEPIFGHLLIVISLGHVSVYSQNDLAHLKHDRIAGKIDKPLVAGEISVSTAVLVIYLLIFTSIFLSAVILPISISLLYTVSVILGIWYNAVSKTRMYSPALLSVWGALIVYIGGISAGSVNIYTHMIAVFMAVHMFIMTVYEGDIKDLGEGENNIAEMECSIYWPREEPMTNIPRMGCSSRFRYSLYILQVIQFGALGIIVLQGSSTLIGLFAVAAIFTSYIGVELISDRKFDDSHTKMVIVTYTVMTVVSVLIAISAIISPMLIAGLVFLSLGWGLGWNTILYGSPFYFP